MARLATGVVTSIAGCTALFFATVKVESASDPASPSTSVVRLAHATLSSRGIHL